VLDWVRWTGIDERHGAAEVLGPSAARWRDGVSCYVVDLPATWDELRASGSGNLRESLRKCRRSLERDGLESSFEVVTTPSRVLGAVDDFLRLHTARASLTDTTHHNDVFAHPACRAFLFDVCDRFAAQGALRIFRLSLGGTLAATRIGFVIGGSLYLYYSGVDPAYAQYGAATNLVAEAMKQAIAERLDTVNLSTGRDASKQRWRPREIAFREAWLVSPRTLGRAKWRAFAAAERAMTDSPMGRITRRLLARRAA
jgi:CelD/BcsL family acetyltransferase involved in cellulose biosynthesis